MHARVGKYHRPRPPESAQDVHRCQRPDSSSSVHTPIIHISIYHDTHAPRVAQSSLARGAQVHTGGGSGWPANTRTMNKNAGLTHGGAPIGPPPHSQHERARTPCGVPPPTQFQLHSGHTVLPTHTKITLSVGGRGGDTPATRASLLHMHEICVVKTTVLCWPGGGGPGGLVTVMAHGGPEGTVAVDVTRERRGLDSKFHAFFTFRSSIYGEFS
jgi:hypothetical protein